MTSSTLTGDLFSFTDWDFSSNFQLIFLQHVEMLSPSLFYLHTTVLSKGLFEVQGDISYLYTLSYFL